MKSKPRPIHLGPTEMRLAERLAYLIMLQLQTL